MTTIYQNDINAVIQIDTELTTLATATELKILVLKPSGAIDVWVATQYLSTSFLNYLTIAGDLNEVGDYYIQAYCKWTAGTTYHSAHPEILPIIAYYTGALDISALVSLFAIYYRNISVQTYAQYTGSSQTGTDSELLYNEFGTYSNLAEDELANIVAARSITLTDTQNDVALCHLIADYFEMGNPDWTFSSQSMGSGVSFSRGEKTGPRAALDKLLDQVQAASKMTRRSGIRMGTENLLQTTDHLNYPRRFKHTQIPAFDIGEDGFDSEPMPDLGDTSDRNY